MTDLDEKTLFGEESKAELIPWPHGYGNIPPLAERTLFGEPARWRTAPWPEGYGPA
jgi:hypothetical protein